MCNHNPELILAPVYRTIPAQASIIAEKWNPFNLNSPLRTYLYQVVNENEAPFFQPNLNYDPNSQIPQEDEQKWEEAALKRPEAKEGVAYVPALVTGFLVLGKRAQRQREFIEKCNIRLHDINASLDAQLEIHSQRIATRVTECRRRHIVASQRTLALAAKIQILRNRGYVMDNAEEELSTKLKQLEREVFDPTLNGREQEIWARMLGIRERGKRLKAEMEKAGPTAKNEDASLDEETVQIAKKVSHIHVSNLSCANKCRHSKHTRLNCGICRRSYNLYNKSTTIGMQESPSQIQARNLGDNGSIGVAAFSKLDSRILSKVAIWTS